MEVLNYINGQLSPSLSGLKMDNFNPGTGQVYGTLPYSDSQDIDLAYSAALKAFENWRISSPEFKFRILNRIADLIEENLEELAQAESIDNGKPISFSRTVDIPRAAANFRFFATAAMQFASESHAMPGAINYTLRLPLGVVGCISPWNLPLYLFTWKIAPALAAGNTVVAKPSELTPVTAFKLAALCIEAGLPPGVLNIVHGTGISCGESIVAHPGIKAISFTGGTITGQKIASIAGPMFKKLSLELGGKNPNIVFADADLELAVKESVRAAFSNQGQICLCGSRIWVHKSIFQTFVDRFIAQVSKKRISFPLDPQADIGALVSKNHMEKVLSYIDVALQEGGKIAFGGQKVLLAPPYNCGWYMQPTVILNLPHDCRTNQEEIFGPVVTIAPFEEENEVLTYANSTKYGLSATLWTKDLSKAHRMAESLECGVVWVNSWLLRDLRTPFGGMKDSGVGREGGWEVMRFFTEPKNVCIKY